MQAKISTTPSIEIAVIDQKKPKGYKRFYNIKSLIYQLYTISTKIASIFTDENADIYSLPQLRSRQLREGIPHQHSAPRVRF